jgi:hypothetical protein
VDFGFGAVILSETVPVRSELFVLQNGMVDGGKHDVRVLRSLKGERSLGRRDGGAQ